MAFADIAIPSIALTQLKAITETVLEDKVQVNINYLNHDLANFLTPDIYRFISNGGGSNNSGFGDWYFRQQAFPQMPDNTEKYIARYGHLVGMEFLRNHGDFLLESRMNLGNFLDRLIDDYGLADVDVVGFTSLFMQNVASIALARKLKERRKDILVVMGGANCETPMGEDLVQNVDVIDYVFSGTSLISFPKLISCIATGALTDAEYINGVFTKNNCFNKVKGAAKVMVTEGGETVTLGPIGDELSINTCVELNYDSFLESFERSFANSGIQPYLLFETSRGCWWGAKAHCTFCGLNGGGMAYRAMKSEYAIDMLQSLFKRYYPRIKHFSCVDNIIPKEYIMQVFSKLEKEKDITMFYEVKADISGEEMKILSEAGVVEMQPGIEALATSTLKLMKKGTTSFNNLRFLQHAITYSVLPYWNLLIGFPGEAEEVYAKYYDDIPLFHHLPPPTGAFPVRFDRYSPYFTEAKKYNLDLQPLDYYSLIYPYPKEVLNEIAYYFSDQNFDAEYINITSRWLNRLVQRVAAWNERWTNFDQASFPKLYQYQENGQDFVYDSRSGKIERKAISKTEKQVLDNLTIKKNMVGLQTEFPIMQVDTLEIILEHFTELGLLFEEKGTFMSLVFESEPVLNHQKLFH